MQVDKAEKEKYQDPKLIADLIDFKKSFAWMFNEVTSVIECRREMEFEKERKSYPFDKKNMNSCLNIRKRSLKYVKSYF